MKIEPIETKATIDMAKVTVTFEIENEDSCEGCPCLAADSEGQHCVIFRIGRLFSLRRPAICKETSILAKFK